MLHLLYVIAFTVLAVIAVSNMLSNLVKLGTQVRQPPGSQRYGSQGYRKSGYNDRGESPRSSVPHPELLDGSGDVINEPLLVMRSISIKDARDQLDAIYEASSGSEDTKES
ncbi:MAG: DUF2973 domain-containing protein [Cyanobacteria bacterium P01_D01_bin.105]